MQKAKASHWGWILVPNTASKEMIVLKRELDHHFGDIIYSLGSDQEHEYYRFHLSFFPCIKSNGLV